MPGAFESARDELYGLDPEQFMARRAELATAARSNGDAGAARQISALRKPTQSAYAVNLLVRAQPDAPDRLAELGAELRDAQQRLDGAAMRELSTQRNALVDELARAALREIDRDGSTALRDEIAGSLSAALADADVLERVRDGALTRAERWAGLGLADGPTLTLVPSPSAEPDAKSTRGAAVADKAQQRRQAAADKAEQTLAAAQRRLDEASDQVAEQRRAVRHAEDQLADARRRLDDAELDLRRARAAADKARAAVDRTRH
jgi:chromosome segregation ATPase